MICAGAFVFAKIIGYSLSEAEIGWLALTGFGELFGGALAASIISVIWNHKYVNDMAEMKKKTATTK